METMSKPPDSGPYLGQGVKRREDPRLLRGDGLYVADVRLPGMAHAAVPRIHSALSRGASRTASLAAASASTMLPRLYSTPNRFT